MNTFRNSNYNINLLSFIGLIICLISLFLPLFSLIASLVEPQIKSTLLSSFQRELSRVQELGFLNYFITSHYVSISILVFPIIGFVLIIIGLFTRKWLAFTGSLFLTLLSLTILYFLSYGINIGSSSYTLIYFSGIGLWGFLIGSLLLVYTFGKEMHRSEILYSLIIVCIVSGILFSKFPIFSQVKIEQQQNDSLQYEKVKSVIEERIKNYSSKFPWTKVDNLKYFGVFEGKFDGYEICALGNYVCDYGKERGENINYIYCKPYDEYFNPYIFCFKKIIVSSSGEIQDVIKKCVYNFAFDPKKLEVVSIKIGQMEKEPPISNC